METKTLSTRALEVIQSYAHFKIGSAETIVPYFNNKTLKARLALRVRVGKGTAKDIHDEVEEYTVKNHINRDTLTNDGLKKILVENNLGLDCSGLTYHVLDAESKSTGNGHLNRRLHFIAAHGPIGKMMCYLRPAENCNVKTFASDLNSRIIALHEIQPGDFISMLGGPDANDRDHILIVTDVICDDGKPISLSYVHTVAYPEDGLYGTGLKSGKIALEFPAEPITKQIWSEEGSPEKARRILDRAIASKTELRRLKWFA